MTSVFPSGRQRKIWKQYRDILPNMMDLKRNKILDFQLVQSNAVGNSVRMEKEGFPRCLSFLEQRGLDVQAVVTDRHTGVQKFLRDERPHITYYFDPWHMGKAYVDKLMALLFDSVVEDPLLYQTTFESIPVPESLCAQFDRPEKQEAVSRHRSRF
ncbi:hypothetical protein WMY93_000094 [Mugilogobius chulae]|uniref:Uncharacterized protein n=1 Tax=Mugilogobius chulae TaxID=88201 RepID=A0AAW0PZZ3_9GOBI